MDRISAFRALGGHAWYGRLFNSLGDSERNRLERFIEEHSHLSPEEFANAANRVFSGTNKADCLASELMLVVNGQPKRRSHHG